MSIYRAALGVFNTVFYINVSELKMIIEQLNQIIKDIRWLEKRFELPPHCNNNELTATAIVNKNISEEMIAKNLYYIVREYALKENEI